LLNLLAAGAGASAKRERRSASNRPVEAANLFHYFRLARFVNRRRRKFRAFFAKFT
jgi:hypothetical protein